MSQVDIAKESARGAFLLLVGNLLSTAILAVAVIVVARLLGPAGYGAYSLVLVLPALLITMIDLGITTSITRSSANYLARGEIAVARRVTRNGIIFVLILGGIATIVCYGGAGLFANLVFHRPELTPYIQIGSFFVLAQTLFNSVHSALLGWKSLGVVGASSILQSVLKLAISASLIVGGFAIYGAVVGQAASYLVTAVVIGLFLAIKKLSGPSTGPSQFFADAKGLLTYGFPIYIGSLASTISTQYLTILVALVATNAVIGFYQTALNMTASFTVVASAVTTALLPAFASLHGAKGDLKLAFSYSTKYVAYSIVPIILFVAVASNSMVEVLFGPAYSASGPFLTYLAIAFLPIALGYSLVPNFFNGIGRSRLGMSVLLVSALTLIVTAPIMVEVLDLGVPGLILAQLLSNLAGALCGLYLASHYLKFGVDLRAVGSILLSSIVAAIAAYSISHLGLPTLLALISELLAFLVVYLTAVPILKGLKGDDITRLEIVAEGLGIARRVFGPILRYERWLVRRIDGS